MLQIPCIILKIILKIIVKQSSKSWNDILLQCMATLLE